MRRILLVVLAVLMLTSGCVSSKQIGQGKLCDNVKDTINMEFQMYGMLMLPAVSLDNMHYCKFMLGPTKAFELLYSEESDSEFAFVKTMSSVKSNAALNGFQVTRTETFSNSSVKSFYVVLKNPKTGEQKTVSGAFDSYSSVVASAVYVFGYPNPFVEPTLLTKIAVRSLRLSNN